MKHQRKKLANAIKKKITRGIYPAVLASFLPAISLAQEAATVDKQEGDSAGMREEIEEVSVLGSRRKQERSALSSPVPVDVLGSAELQRQGNTETIETLISMVPSLNANREPNSDAATMVRPVNLRALPADSTLILVNGKRRHRGAAVGEFVSGVNAGAQAVDVTPLFGAALSSVEILRDGAAAQYGSDAIAGVINYNLLSDPDVRRVSFHSSQAYEGDGTTIQGSGAFGMHIGDGGFATFAIEMRDQQDTSRGVQDGGAENLDAAGFPIEQDPVVIWGQPIVEDDLKIAFNSEIPVGNSAFYAFATGATRTVDGSFFYRNPTNRTDVFTDDDGNVLFADTTGAGGCPVGPLPTTSYADAQALLGSAPDNCFSFHEFYPGGFTPRFGGTVDDLATTAGFRGEMDSGLTYDFSVGFGENELSYQMRNSLNASLGPDSPTSFDLGVQTESEIVANADFAYGLEVGLASPLNVAFGLQYHDEEFEISPGDPEASVVGPYVDQDFSVGSNGFAGFSEAVSGVFSRNSSSVYVDLEADVTNNLILSTAVRYEDFSDFGETFNGKFAGIYHITDNFAVRGSLSTGFRAPTLGQSFLQRSSFGFSADAGGLVSQLQVSSVNPIAEFFGGGQLDAETSENLSIGFTTSFAGIDLTVDYFDIDVEDRIAQTFANLTAADQEALVDQGVSEAATLSRVTFFVNDFDSNTRGVDVVANYGFETDLGDTDLTLAFNWNDTTVTDRGQTISDGRKREIEDALPDIRTTFTVSHTKGAFSSLVRVNYYGEAYESLFNDPTLPVVTDPLIIVDAELGWDFNDSLSVAIGAKNLFDEQPDEWQIDDWNGRTPGFLGAIYPVNHIAGFNGGSYYLRLSKEF